MKYCPRCCQQKDEKSFRFSKAKQALQAYCIPCNKAYSKQHYLNNKVDYKLKALKRDQTIKEKIRNIKTSSPCTDCNLYYPYYVMEFDHVHGIKSFGIAEGSKFAWDKLVAEIEKCELVCSNCHRVRTHKRANLVP